MRTKVCAADWNGDGRLDLLVGDYSNQKPAPVELTPEKKAEQDRVRAELAPVEQRYREVVTKYLDDNARKSRTAEELAQLEKELGEVSRQMQELRKKVPPEYETHGWVWLYLRKPADQASAGAKAE
jgi:hypothetical protein